MGICSNQHQIFKSGCLRTSAHQPSTMEYGREHRTKKRMDCYFQRSFCQSLLRNPLEADSTVSHVSRTDSPSLSTYLILTHSSWTNCTNRKFKQTMARLFSSKSRHQWYCNRCLAWDKGISMVKVNLFN
ncbi:hypothetical protein SDJN02_26714, partial [Cucurbita argyrosperma subsp. argyrosperma]